MLCATVKTGSDCVTAHSVAVAQTGASLVATAIRYRLHSRHGFHSGNGLAEYSFFSLLQLLDFIDIDKPNIFNIGTYVQKQTVNTSIRLLLGAV